MTHRRLLKCLGLALLVATEVASAGNPHASGDDDADWSKGIDNLRGRVVLKPFEVENGTLIVHPYLELQNQASAAHFAWKSAKMTFHVVDAAGHELKPSCTAYDGFERPRADLVIPLEGEVSFNIAGDGAGIPGDMGAILDLGDPDATWTIPRNGKVYFLKADLETTGKQAMNADGIRNWTGEISLPAVEIPERAPQPDPSKAGAIIDDLGRKMLLAHGAESAEATRKLSLIDDPRVVNWYVKAVKTNDYGSRIEALDKLARFPGDAALEGLKIGMHTTASDLRDGGVDSAENVRESAAMALARSPHPKAKELLLTMANDHAYGVRLEVIHTAAFLNTPESRSLLKLMSADRNPDVRNEALRELALTESSK